MKTHSTINRRELFGLVWKEKWQQAIGSLSLFFSAWQVSKTSLAWAVINVLVAIVLVVDIALDFRKTLHLLREKHLPFLLNVGSSDDEFKGMLTIALERMRSEGFDATLLAKEYDIAKEDFSWHYENELPPNQEDWEKLVRSTKERIERVEARLKGQKVFHLFLRCPAALALGLGAKLGTKCAAVVYHFADGRYLPVLDLHKGCSEDGQGSHQLKQQPPLQYQWITIQKPENLSAETYVYLNLASHSVSNSLRELSGQHHASLVIVNNLYGNNLPANESWIPVVQEVSHALRQLVSEPGVQKLHLFLSAPLPLAFGVGMGLGNASSVRVYNWYHQEQQYHAVLNLHEL